MGNNKAEMQSIGSLMLRIEQLERDYEQLERDYEQLERDYSEAQERLAKEKDYLLSIGYRMCIDELQEIKDCVCYNDEEEEVFHRYFYESVMELIDERNKIDERSEIK